MTCNHVYMVLTVFIFISVYVPLTTSSPINVSLGFLTPLDESLGPLSTLGKELQSAFKLAVKAVNENGNKDGKVFIREDFAAAVKDETSEPSNACRLAADAFHKDSEYVGIVGAYSSECSVSVQKQLKKLKSYLSQLSYRSPSMQLSKGTEYSGFYRMASNNKEQAQVVIDLIKHFRWSQVGILHTSDFYYGQELSDEIVSKLTSRYNIRIRDRRSFKVGASDLKIDESLYEIKKSGSQINIIIAQGNDVFRLLRRIKAKNMFGPGWVWILTDGGTCLDLSNDHDANITASGMVGISPEMFKGKAYVDNVIVKWFHVSEEEYPGKFWKSNEQMPSISPFVGQVYLAVSTYYNMLTELADLGNLTQETDVVDIRKMLRRKLNSMESVQTASDSILGNKVYFTDGRDGPPTFTITNYVGELFKTVGTWDGTRKDESDRLRLDLKSAIIWPGGSLRPPKFKGKPGKLSFRIAFVAPTDSTLGSLSDIGQELVSAFKVAVDMINDDKGYQIEIETVVYNEGMDGAYSCSEIAKEMKSSKLVAVVGAYRSECSMRLHTVLGTDEIRMPIVSYASLSRELSNKDLYKYFFRVVPPNTAQAEILKELILKYRFKEVSILYSDETSSKEIAQQFAIAMKNNSVPVTLKEEFAQNSNADTLRKHLLQIRQSGSRVVFVSSLPNDARLITQLIKELEMAGKGWIWFGSTGTTTQHFRRNSNIGRLLNGMIGINPKDGEGPLYTRFRSVWKSKDSINYPGIIHTNKIDKTRPYTAQVYDAVRALALSLSDLVSKKLVTFKTTRLTTRQLLYEKLRGFNSGNGFLSATGQTSKMFFDKNQDAPLSFDVVNLVDNTWKTIGRYPKKRDGIQFIKDPLFPGGYSRPVVNPGKIIYKVAAFFPMHYRLNALSELGLKWKAGLEAATNWLSKNDSLTVGFELVSYDTGLYSSANCSKLAEGLRYVDIVIGAARSECTSSLYRALESRGVPVITYSSTSAVLSHKASYPNLFRVCSSDIHQAVALSDLVEKYSWEKVGMVGSKGIYGRELSSKMQDELKVRDIAVSSSQFFSEGDLDMGDQMKRLKSAGSGVNMIIANPSDSMQLFQNAFEINMVGKGWTWIGSDGATSTSFKIKQNLLAAMQGMVGIRPKAGSGPLFDSIFKELLQIDLNADKKTAYLAQVFDAVLLPAYALHAMHMKRQGSSTMGKISSQELLDHLRNMQSSENGFKSTIGRRQYFDMNQDVVPYYDLVNLNGGWITVGSFENGQLDITRGVVWPGGTIKVPPSDQPRYETSPQVSDVEGGTSVGLIVLAVVFGGFSLLVIIFMIYIVRRVRHRHLYMQSDINHGGVFSVLYGHTVNRPSIPLQSQCTLPLQSNGQSKLDSMDSGTGPEILEPMIPGNV